MLISVWIFQRWRARRLETQNVIQEQGENKIGKGGYKQTRFIFFQFFSLIPCFVHAHNYKNGSVTFTSRRQVYYEKYNLR